MPCVYLPGPAPAVTVANKGDLSIDTTLTPLKYRGTVHLMGIIYMSPDW